MDNLIKTVIVDDNSDVIDSIKDLVMFFNLELDILGTANDVESGKKLVKKYKPKLLFLDIEMPDGNGFDLVDGLEYIPAIVFITGHSQYALQAFDYPAIHFLVKPISIFNLREAIQKYHDFQEQFSKQSANIENSVQNIPANKIAIPQNDGIKIYDIHSIVRLEGDGNYTNIIFTNGSKLLISRTISAIESILPAEQFLRIHKSHIVNLQHIKSLPKGGKSLFVEMDDDAMIGVAKERKEIVLETLKKFTVFLKF
jgi:two-component system LytT family response regulator